MRHLCESGLRENRTGRLSGGRRPALRGASSDPTRDLLGHKTTVMADWYVRAIGNPVRDAREQVDVAMAAMMAGKGGEVVPLRRSG